MDLPITRPVQLSYGDELNFYKFLEKLARKEYNGFIRVTHASSEGYILLKKGIPIAASYDRYMKSEAMEKILEIIDKIDTLIELFEIRESQMDYLIKINKVYKFEPTKPTKKEPTKPTKTSGITRPEEVSKTPDEREKRLSREELMQKYGLKEIDEEEIEKVLETYKGGAITTVDIERIEEALINRIEEAIMVIPDIRNVKVMIFLENAPEFGGDIKVLIERESKGLVSLLIGGSMSEEEVRKHAYDIIEMELKRTFRDYPEIIENFNVDIEIH
ncbi:conserved hypothetical protein [Methanothermobacter sp. MT-2]|nr:conserved hypothetical protein [Methanothermobacter sp. MT-2]